MEQNTYKNPSEVSSGAEKKLPKAFWILIVVVLGITIALATHFLYYNLGGKIESRIPREIGIKKELEGIFYTAVYGDALYDPRIEKPKVILFQSDLKSARRELFSYEALETVPFDLSRYKPALSPDKQKLAYVDKVGVHIVDLNGLAKETIARSDYSLTNELARKVYSGVSWSLNSKFIALQAGGYEISFTELYDLERRRSYEIEEGEVRWAPNGRMALIGGCGVGASCSLSWSESQTPYNLKPIKDYSPEVIAWSPRSDKIAILHGDLRLYSLNNSSIEKELSTELIPIDAYSSDSLSMFFARDENKVLIFYKNGLWDWNLSINSLSSPKYVALNNGEVIYLLKDNRAVVRTLRPSGYSSRIIVETFVLNLDSNRKEMSFGDSEFISVVER